MVYHRLLHRPRIHLRRSAAWFNNDTYWIDEPCRRLALSISAGQKTLSGAMDGVPKNSRGRGIPAIAD